MCPPVENACSRVVIVSNRLPVTFSKEEGKIQVTPASGGLVTALKPILNEKAGCWIGWSGTDDFGEEELQLDFQGLALLPLALSQEEVALFYRGFSNAVIWPLFHDLPSLCDFQPEFWKGYESVNQKFAARVAEKIEEQDFVWVHDYQLMLVGQFLRERKNPIKLSFFLHIPFPSWDIFAKLPWRMQVLSALLEYDLIGFQTVRDKRNFIECLRRLMPHLIFQSSQGFHVLKGGPREVKVGAFPISVDYQEIVKQGAAKEVADSAWYIHEKFPGQQIVFSLDRLDPSKGIPFRLEAIRHLLKHHPDLHQKVTFVQVVIPSRTEVPLYQNLKQAIDQLVGDINSQFTKEAWVPIHYSFRSLKNEELLGYYKTSEMLLVTPLKDGMNLVAKEYIAANVDLRGVLVLSEFAGAASQLQKGALVINPYDIEGLSHAIYKGLNLNREERAVRMRHMRRQVARYDIFWWAKAIKNQLPKEEV